MNSTLEAVSARRKNNELSGWLLSVNKEIFGEKSDFQGNFKFSRDTSDFYGNIKFPGKHQLFGEAAKKTPQANTNQNLKSSQAWCVYAENS